MLTRITKAEWMKKGKELFGENTDKWRFVCPGCGCVQSIEDFRPYKDQGATPDSATHKCLGRYTGGRSWLDDKPVPGQRCDYTGYGLLCICPIIVIDGDKEIRCFAFDEGENTLKL
jgi:hypothetical protein